jgi:flavin reductase (DIM6/NTAB) family NADH-FMN oxidoreductase RutF
VEIAASSLSKRAAYAWMTSLVVPRPIAWVTTSRRLTDGTQHINVAPFSYFNAVCSDPPTISLAIAKRADGTPKDTVRLIDETGVFCVHSVAREHAVAMNATSAALDADDSELPLTGMATVQCVSIDGVRLVGPLTALECKKTAVHPIGRDGHVSLVIAEVLHLFVDDTLIEAGGVNAAFSPIARLSGDGYVAFGERFAVKR